MKRIALVLATLLAVLAGCDGDSNKLVVAVDATYQPFEFYDENHEIAGFEIDLCREVAKRAGYEVEFVNQPWDGIIPGLQSKKYDLIFSSMTITEERSRELLFSEPYYDAGQVIAGREDQQGIETLDHLEGKKIGAQRGTTGAIKAHEVQGAEVKEYDSIDLAFLDLKNGSIDAVINDEPASRALVQAKGGAKLVGVPLTDEKYGIAFRKEDGELAKKFNAALAEVKKDGTYEKLRKKWLEGKAE